MTTQLFENIDKNYYVELKGTKHTVEIIDARNLNTIGYYAIADRGLCDLFEWLKYKIAKYLNQENKNEENYAIAESDTTAIYRQLSECCIY